MAIVRIVAGASSSLGMTELAFARTVVPAIAALPVHVALGRLQGTPDCVLGSFSPDEAEAIRAQAVERGLVVEIDSREGYDGAYVERKLGCAPLADGAVRGVFRPSFSPERVITAVREEWGFAVEVRTSREHLWQTQFSAWLLSRAPRVLGVDVLRGDVKGDVCRQAAAHLAAALAGEEEERGLGLDGTTIALESRLPELICAFEVWSPREAGKRGFELVAMLRVLAMALESSAS